MKNAVLAFSALAILALFVGGAFAEERELPKIAIYVSGDVSENEKKALGTRILSSIIGRGGYRGGVDASTFGAEVEKEQLKRRGLAIDDAKMSALGREAGVDFLCIVDVTPVLGDYQVSARIMNVETVENEFIGESTSRLMSIGDLATVSDQVVGKMFGESVAPTPAPTAATAPSPAAAPTPEAPALQTAATDPVSEPASKPEKVQKREPKPKPEPKEPKAKPEPKEPKAKPEPKEPKPKPEPKEPKPKPEPKEPKPKPEFASKAGMRLGAGTGGQGTVSGGGGIKTMHGLQLQTLMPQAGGGAYFFFDATYATATVALSAGGGTWDCNDPQVAEADLPDMQYSSVAIGVFAKYPIPVTPTRSVIAFPQIGLDYEISTSAKLVYADKSKNVPFDGKGDDPKADDLSALWVKFGGGVDVYVIENLYIRAEALYGMRTNANAFEKAKVDEYNGRGDKSVTQVGHGGTFRLGVGYRF